MAFLLGFFWGLVLLFFSDKIKPYSKEYWILLGTFAVSYLVGLLT